MTAFLFDVSVELFHYDDELDALKSALVSYDNYEWGNARIALEPIARTGNLRALFKYANTLDNLNEVDAAVHFWQIGVRGGDTDACNNLANHYKAIGKIDEAKRLYEIAAAVDQPHALFNLGLLLEDEDPDMAARYFEAAVSAGHGQVCGKLAHESRVDGRIDLMLEYALLGVERGDFFSPMVLALYYFENQNLEVSLRYVNIALSTSGVERRPQYGSALSLLASVQVSMDDFDAGLHSADLAVAQGSTDAQAIVDLLSPRFRRCSNCLKPFDPVSQFCTQCGQKIPQR